MEMIKCSGSELVAHAVEKRMSEILTAPHSRVFLPAGQTPKPLYDLLAKKKSQWSGKLIALQIDDFVDPGRPFYSQLKNEVIDPLKLGAEVWDPSFSEKEIQAHVKRVTEKPVALAVLGLGLNGHVGFHEPGQKRDFVGGRVRVSKETQARCKSPTGEALSFGVGAFMKTQHVFLVVTGESKKEIFESFLKSEPSENLPASLLKDHDHLTVFTDL